MAFLVALIKITNINKQNKIIKKNRTSVQNSLEISPSQKCVFQYQYHTCLS